MLLTINARLMINLKKTSILIEAFSLGPAHELFCWLDVKQDSFTLYHVNIEKFLDLFFHRNVLIIEVLFGTVLLGVVFLAIRSYLRPEGQSGEMNLGGLEEGLKKIIENYSGGGAGPAKVETAAEGDAIMEEMATQIERLKLQLMQKTEEVEQLKAGGVFAIPGAAPVPEAPVAKTSSASSGVPSDLEEKVRELEARLSEYSIIEDDIADLSFYKEETVRLQGEIDKLKAKLAEYESGGPPPKFMAPPPPAASATPAASTSEPPQASSSPAVANKPPVEPTPLTAETASSTPPLAAASNSADAAVDDDIMAEFERAVAEQKAMSSAQKIATSLAPNPTTTPTIDSSSSSEPTSQAVTSTASTEPDAAPFAEPALASHSEETTDVSELTSASAQEPEASNDLAINLDKMLSEVGSLPEQIEEEIPNALEQELDTEKLLKEATGMDKVDTEAIDGFDEFLKKEGA